MVAGLVEDTATVFWPIEQILMVEADGDKDETEGEVDVFVTPEATFCALLAANSMAELASCKVDTGSNVAFESLGWPDIADAGLLGLLTPL